MWSMFGTIFEWIFFRSSCLFKFIVMFVYDEFYIKYLFFYICVRLVLNFEKKVSLVDFLGLEIELT